MANKYETHPGGKHSPEMVALSPMLRGRLDERNAWVVWSYEHKAWWGPDHCGYYVELRHAGRYSEADAKAIVLHSQNGYELDNEVALPLAFAGQWQGTKDRKHPLPWEGRWTRLS